MDTSQPDTFDDREIDFELSLEEDIDGELEEFCLLWELGIYDEARDIADTLLWRHLRRFDVFAKVADFVISRNDLPLRERLRNTIPSERLAFDSFEQQNFLHAITAVLRCEVTIQPSDILAFDQFESSILCHKLEIEINLVMIRQHCIEVAYYHEKFYDNIRILIDRFLQHGLVKNATRCFVTLIGMTLAVSQRPNHVNIRHIDRSFSQIKRGFQPKLRTQTGSTLEQTQRFALAANVALFRLLGNDRFSKLDYKFEHIKVEDVLGDTEVLLATAFEVLPDSSRRGSHLEIYNEARKVHHQKTVYRVWVDPLAHDYMSDDGLISRPLSVPSGTDMSELSMHEAAEVPVTKHVARSDFSSNPSSQWAFALSSAPDADASSNGSEDDGQFQKLGYESAWVSNARSLDQANFGLITEWLATILTPFDPDFDKEEEDTLLAQHVSVSTAYTISYSEYARTPLSLALESPLPVAPWQHVIAPMKKIKKSTMQPPGTLSNSRNGFHASAAEPDRDAPFTFNVGIFDRPSITVSMASSATVADLKTKLAGPEMANIPSDLQDLTYDSKTLKDHDTLDSYNLTAADTIQLKRRSRVVSNETQMIQDAYCTVKRNVTIIVCNSSASIRQDAQTSRDPSPDVSIERAYRYLEQHHNADNGLQSCLEFMVNADAASIPPESVVIAYIFDEVSETLFRFLQGSSSDAEHSDGLALNRFLNTSIWKHIASVRSSRPEIKIALSSGPTHMHLEEFTAAIKRLVEGGGVNAYTSALGRTERSRFWHSLVVPAAPIGAKGHYTYANAPLSDIDFGEPELLGILCVLTAVSTTDDLDLDLGVEVDGEDEGEAQVEVKAEFEAQYCDDVLEHRPIPSLTHSVEDFARHKPSSAYAPSPPSAPAFADTDIEPTSPCYSLLDSPSPRSSPAVSAPGFEPISPYYSPLDSPSPRLAPVDITESARLGTGSSLIAHGLTGQVRDTKLCGEPGTRLSRESILDEPEIIDLDAMAVDDDESDDDEDGTDGLNQFFEEEAEIDMEDSEEEVEAGKISKEMSDTRRYPREETSQLLCNTAPSVNSVPAQRAQPQAMARSSSYPAQQLVELYQELHAGKITRQEYDQKHANLLEKHTSSPTLPTAQAASSIRPTYPVMQRDQPRPSEPDQFPQNPSFCGPRAYGSCTVSGGSAHFGKAPLDTWKSLPQNVLPSTTSHYVPSVPHAFSTPATNLPALSVYSPRPGRPSLPPLHIPSSNSDSPPIQQGVAHAAAWHIGSFGGERDSHPKKAKRRYYDPPIREEAQAKRIQRSDIKEGTKVASQKRAKTAETSSQPSVLDSDSYLQDVSNGNFGNVRISCWLTPESFKGGRRWGKLGRTDVAIVPFKTVARLASDNVKLNTFEIELWLAESGKEGAMPESYPQPCQGGKCSKHSSICLVNHPAPANMAHSEATAGSVGTSDTKGRPWRFRSQEVQNCDGRARAAKWTWHSNGHEPMFLHGGIALQHKSTPFALACRVRGKAFVEVRPNVRLRLALGEEKKKPHWWALIPQKSDLDLSNSVQELEREIRSLNLGSSPSASESSSQDTGGSHGRHYDVGIVKGGNVIFGDVSVHYGMSNAVNIPYSAESAGQIAAREMSSVTDRMMPPPLVQS